MGYHSKSVDVGSAMKNSLNELQNVYNYFVANPGPHKAIGAIKTGKKPGNGGDVEITLDNPAYADSAWYVADPFANYAPYEDFKTFAVYENYMGNNPGPFKAVACQCAKYNGDMTRSLIQTIFESMVSIQRFYMGKKDRSCSGNTTLFTKTSGEGKFLSDTLTFTSTIWLSENTSLFVPADHEREHL